MDDLARIHDQVLNDYVEGNPYPDPDIDPEDVPPWVDDYEKDCERTENGN